jgi:hypothetical protein
MVVASILVGYNENAATYLTNRAIPVPCNFNTPISITLGGKQFVISPSSFVRHTETFNECIANAVAHSNLPNGGKLAPQFSCGRADGL